VRDSKMTGSFKNEWGALKGAITRVGNSQGKKEALETTEKGRPQKNRDRVKKALTGTWGGRITGEYERDAQGVSKTRPTRVTQTSQKLQKKNETISRARARVTRDER